MNLKIIIPTLKNNFCFVSIFCVKKLSENDKCLGAIFRTAREKFDLDLCAASKAARIPKKYLECLEKNKFSGLPKAKVYRLNYVKEYAHFLHLDESEMLKQFEKENGLKGTEIIHPKQHVRNTPLFSFSILIRNLLIAGLILSFTGYLAYQVKRVLEPPRLFVYNPTEGITINDYHIAVQGETEKECQLSINGKEIMPDEKGRFNLSVDLSEGLNTIIITATKKHGKNTTLTRHIVVKNISYSTEKIISYQ